jgi:hypothetical protein
MAYLDLIDTDHLQEEYCTTTLPITGPMLKPARSPQMKREIAKLLLLPSLHISLTIPPVMLARTPEQLPVMMRVMISVVKFCAKACGTIKTVRSI